MPELNRAILLRFAAIFVIAGIAVWVVLVLMAMIVGLSAGGALAVMPMVFAALDAGRQYQTRAGGLPDAATKRSLAMRFTGIGLALSLLPAMAIGLGRASAYQPWIVGIVLAVLIVNFFVAWYFFDLGAKTSDRGPAA